MKVAHSDAFDEDKADDFDAGRAARPILAIIIATAVFYFASEILVPLAVASVLAVIFSPVTSRLEPFVGRFVSAAVVVFAAIVTITAGAYFLTVELASVADEVSGYSSNIATKLSTLEKSTPFWLQHVEHGIAEVEERLERANPTRTNHKPIVVQSLPSSP